MASQSKNTIIENPSPLDTLYVPRDLLNRERERAVLRRRFSRRIDTENNNLFVYGPCGSGKTHLTINQLGQLPEAARRCYLPCHIYDTPHKVLGYVYRKLSGEDVRPDHTTADLKHYVERVTQTTDTLIILDDVEFLLQKSEGEVLEYVSRLTDNRITVGLISSTYANLANHVDERIYRGLEPHYISFEPYTENEVYRILLNRAQKSLATRSLRKEALSYIASQTANIQLGLHWLGTAANDANKVISKNLVEQLHAQAYRNYATDLLSDFSEHHRLLFQAIDELTVEHSGGIRSGQIYDRYEGLCQSYDNCALSRRRISDLLKHLELLGLITADYHYGGRNGSTRTVDLNRPGGHGGANASAPDV